MFSTGAFNALLKTLEEPPPHVIFILATTEPHKVPKTIHSRCQRFDFKRITTNQITEAIKKYAKDENVLIEENAIKYIAQISDGAMRDALSILDQCISFHFNENITLEKVLEIVGSVDNAVFFNLTDALFEKNSLKCIEIINEIAGNGRDISQFVSELIAHFRNLLVSLSGSELLLPTENISSLFEKAVEIGAETLIYYINTFSSVQGEMKLGLNERIFLEVACIKICNVQIQKPEKTENSEEFENFRSSGIKKDEKQILTNKAKKAEAASETSIKKQAAASNKLESLIKNWNDFLLYVNTLGKLSPLAFKILKSTRPICSGDSSISVNVKDSHKEFVSNENVLTSLKEALESKLDFEVDIKICSASSVNNNSNDSLFETEDLKFEDEIGNLIAFANDEQFYLNQTNYSEYKEEN